MNVKATASRTPLERHEQDLASAKEQYLNRVRDIKQRFKFDTANFSDKAKTIVKLIATGEKNDVRRGESLFNCLPMWDRKEVFRHIMKDALEVEVEVGESIPFFLGSMSTGAKVYNVAIRYRSLKIRVAEDLRSKPPTEAVESYCKTFLPNIKRISIK